MTRYAVLLRGVNVGGHGKVPMPRLRELAAELGYRDVATYVQSGNLIVSSGEDAGSVRDTVQAAVKREFGVAAAVVVRSRDEIAAIVAADVLGKLADDPSKRLVSFLSEQPEAGLVARLDPDEFAPERFEVVGRELYLWCPDGLGQSKLAAAPWGRRLGGVTATGRNWRTVLRLLEMLDDA